MGGLNWKGGAEGAAEGAIQGAPAGPHAAAAAGIIKGTLGLFSKKKKKKAKTRSTLDKKQQEINDLQHQGLKGEGAFADLYNYDPEAANRYFDETIGKYAYRDLNETGIPGVTGQFRSKGLMQSSYAGDAVAKLVRDVQEKLNSERSKFIYEGEQAAKNAKRQGLENFQNRQTFAYDTAAPSSGNGFMGVMNQISPQQWGQAGEGATDFMSKFVPNSALGPVA